jgi:hypothetical protein
MHIERRHANGRMIETADGMRSLSIALAELRAVQLYAKTHGDANYTVRWTGGGPGIGAPVVSPAPTRVADARAKLAAILR